MSLETRTTTTPVVVGNIMAWLEKNNALVSWRYRTDAADTDQGEGGNLDYDHVYRKLFQKTRVF
jgi:hypothetical protein